MPLLLSRKVNESFVVGEDVVVMVVRIRPERVVLMVQAPEEVKILRSELIPPDQAGPSDLVLMRNKMIEIARQWHRDSANGMDVLASSCLDEMQSLIAAVRA